VKTFLFALLFITPSLKAKDLSELRVRAYTKLNKAENVTLLDVVEADRLSTDAQKILKNVVLGDAPKEGEQRVYSTKHIADSLRTGLGRRFSGVKIPNQVVVANRGYEIDAEILKAELLSRWQIACDECRFVFQNIKLPVMSADYKGFPWRIEFSTQMPKGSFSEKLWVERSSNDRQLFWLTGQVQTLRKVPVATKALLPGMRIMPSDIKYDWRDTTFATDGIVDEKNIIGQEVRFAVSANDIVWARAVQRERAVRRGDIVKVFVGEGNWQVTLEAQTQQDGYVGDIVTVKNLQTKKLMSGEVVGVNEVALK
jgi:flagella basal body P-ring formation protein FlgA